MYSRPKRRIEADEFVLRDANGSMRAALTMTLDGPGLFLYDQSEVIRAGLLIGKDEPALALFDRLGRPRVSLGLAGDEPKLLLRDVKGIPRAAMIVGETGTRLMLSHANPGPRVGFAAENGEANMVFADPNGKPRVVLGMPGGFPGLTLLDASGRRRAKLEIEEHTSTFELYDSDGQTSSSQTVGGVAPHQDAADVEAKLALEATARKQLEETLRARERRYNALTAATAQLVWTTNAAGEITEAVPSWMTFTGQSADEAQGGGWLQALHPEDRERAGEVLKQALDTRRPYETEYRLRRHDGEYRVLAVRGAPVVEDDGAVHEWMGTANDITEAKQAEMLRQASEKKYRQIVERAPEGIWIVDPDNRTRFANPRLAQMLGWSEEKMAGKSLLDFLDEADRPSAGENLACCRRGVAVQFDLKLRTLEGHDLRTRASTLPLFDEAGQYSGALALIVDLTEPKLLEGQQQQAQKLQALGQLAGGVAHGLNNFLTVINGYTGLLLGKVPRSNPMYESVAQIKKAAEQAAGLVSPLLAFSQGQMLWARALDLNEVVTEVEKTLRGQWGEDIRLATVLSPTLGPVKADPEQLRQVLMILAANARDAMRSGGSLVIETQNADLDESYAAKHLGVKPGPYVHLTVSDSGMGMSAETLAHLFEPFFTTKAPGEGSGLGLASAYGFIQQSGGSMRVESEWGKGSTIHLYLPRLGETVPLPEEEKPAVTTLRGTETVLVVEDQEEIRKLAQMVLKSYGYKVVVAENGWEALLYSERHAGPIHLMLTDVVMPGMTGQELADRLRPLRPEMKVAFMSGYLENGTVPPGALEAGAGFLAKPFSPEALATKVREVLGPPRSAGKVLVVDAEPGIRSFLLMVLGSVGYEVLAADNGEQALKNLDGERVDLILVDLGKSGPPELEKIRLLQKRHPDLKVIAMSGTFGDEFLRAAEQLGAQATLAKPIRADQLLETVRRTATE